MPIQTLVFVETSPAAPGTVASSQPVQGSPSANMPPGVAGLFDDYESIDVVAEIQGATGGALAVYLQISPDGGISNWYDIIAWPSATAGSGVKYYQSPLSLATTTTTTTVVGKNLVPALSAGSSGAVVNGAFNDRCRIVMVAGSGTTQGTVVVVRLAAQRGRLREAGD